MSLNRSLSSSLRAGAIHGAAAWSAYAVVEFVFSSVLFRMTRPYSVFTVWHWRLTAILLVGFLTTGAALGAAAGFLSWVLRVRSPRALELAATLTLSLALAANLVIAHTVFWLQLAALAFVVLLVAALLFPGWRDRAGLLTNYWVVSALLLGLGQEFSLLEMGMAAQLGARVGLWTRMLAILLLSTAAISFFLRRAAGSRWITAASLALGGALLLFSAMLSGPAQTRVHAAASALPNAGRPNVFLIVMDTVRADHLSAFGYTRDTTPRLRELARDSAVYPNAFSASDITLTAHASLFTGMYPSWHGAYCQPPEAAYGRELSSQYPTLAELLRASGYETIGVAANLYLRSDFGLERGFGEFRIPRPVPMLPDEARYLLRRSLRRGLSFVTDTAQFDRLYTLGEDIDTALFAAVERPTRRGAPLFVFMNYMDAHYPYVPPAPYSAAFPGRRARITQDDLEEEQNQISRGEGHPAGYAPHAISQYDGGIRNLDAQVGRVVDWLKQQGAYESSMIVIAADHGESFGERNRVGHANSPYQNLLHVPLLVKYPHNQHRGEDTRAASLIDVAPTVLAAAGATAPPSLQGRDLGATDAPRSVYAETFVCPVMHSPDCPNGCSAKAIVNWPMKFIDSSNGKRELFDLAKDPNETRNLYIEQSDRASEMAAALFAWKKSIPAQTRQNRQVDPEKLKQLQGLGYVQ